MSSLTFTQSARRNLALPAAAAIIVLGSVSALIYRLIPRAEASATITQVRVHPVQTIYKQEAPARGFRIQDPKQVSEKDLYIVPTVHIEDHVGVPLFLKDFRVNLTTAEGELHTSAIEQNDLATVDSAFPEIKALMPNPLLRETSVAPQGAVEGTLLVQLRVPQATWEQRKSATLTIDFYHQRSIMIPFPEH